MLMALTSGREGEHLSIVEASALSGFGSSTIRRAIKSGNLRASQPNGARGRLLVAERDLDEWLTTPPADSSSYPEPEPTRVRIPARRNALIGPDFDEPSIREFAKHRTSDRS